MNATIDRSFSDDKIYIRFSVDINDSMVSEFIKHKWIEVTEKTWSKAPCSILTYDEGYRICSSFNIGVDGYIAENEISIITNSAYDACEKMQIEIKSVPDHLYILFYKSKIDSTIGGVKFVNNPKFIGLVKKYHLPSRDQFSQRHMHRYHNAYINAVAYNKQKIKLHYNLLSKCIRKIHIDQKYQSTIDCIDDGEIKSKKVIINISNNLEIPAPKVNVANVGNVNRTDAQLKKFDEKFEPQSTIKNQSSKKDKRIGIRSKLNASDLLFRKKGITCYKGHVPIGLDGIVPIITAYGKLSKMRIPISYCPICKQYYISENIYKKKKNNIIICRILKSDKHDSDKVNNFLDWNPQSLLMAYGYTVKKDSKLTVEQRRCILITIINNNILSKEKILSYLNLFERINQSEWAKQSWKSDIEYIKDYKFK